MKNINNITLQCDLDIKINGFYLYWQNQSEAWFPSSLIIDEEKIEICLKCRIDPLSSSLLKQLNDSDYSKFGERLQFKNVTSRDSESYHFDFTLSKLISIHIEDNAIYFTIDSIRWEYPKQTLNPKAIFHLNNAGLKFAQNSCGLILFNDDLTEFIFRGNDKSYNLFKTKYTPKILFLSSDGLYQTKIHIKKKPIIEWDNFSSIEEVIEYNKWICLIASLFYQTRVDFISSFIEFGNKVTVIYQRFKDDGSIPEKDFLFPIRYMSNIDTFIRNINFDIFKDNSVYIERAIKSFLQIQYLDGNILYLILYNIIETCKSCYSKHNKTPKDTFSNLKKIKKQYKECLNEVIYQVSTDEQEDFKNRWESLWIYLQIKPMKKEMYQFLEKKGFNLDNIKSSVLKNTDHKYDDLVSIRNNITHSGGINQDNIDMCGLNYFLSLIAVILILDMIGFEKIQLDKGNLYSNIIND